MAKHELLAPVDWTASRAAAVNEPPAIGKSVSEAERVALLVLSLGRKREKTNRAVAKILRMALREIEQAVLSCEQDIDFEIDQ